MRLFYIIMGPHPIQNAKAFAGIVDVVLEYIRVLNIFQADFRINNLVKLIYCFRGDGESIELSPKTIRIDTRQAAENN